VCGVDPVLLARRVLERCGYLDTCLRTPRLDLAVLLRQHGLEWHRRPFVGLAGALVVFDAEYHVVTNAHEGWARQRFTAAHELKHFLTDLRLARVFMCRREVDRGIERAANIFARELLMPAEVMRFLYGRGFDTPLRIGRVLGVSAQAAGIRMAELGLGEGRVWWAPPDHRRKDGTNGEMPAV